MIVAQHAPPSDAAVYAIIGFMVVVTMLPSLLWIWMLFDCIRNEPKGTPERTKWIVFVALLGPLAAIIYHTGRRKRRIREYGR
jgi:hypothetical protein